jgi:alginate O-acetyltransferase complex protein AlgI
MRFGEPPSAALASNHWVTHSPTPDAPMLFTTTTFVLFFLPLTLGGFYLLGQLSSRAAVSWLLLASLAFYAHWMPSLTLLLVGSIAVNFVLGRRIALRPKNGRNWLIVGLSFNLGLLAYFKYANFFADNLGALLGMHWRLGEIVLPVGISFYSFTQIAFLVDCWQGKVIETRAAHYGLFVTYFPHLVAGPVLHHAQMMPQFADPKVVHWCSANVVAGLAIFALGLLKKVVLADGIAPYSDAVFDPVDRQLLTPTSLEAWLATLAYTFQLYFDFSAYSDMAIGLSWMFNIRLPFNFDSPYRATSISDFWRRWHISLSSFLRDYLYVPLGGNRKGTGRRYLNLGITMVLGGLWHGANWSFVLWGALHGAYLMVNHGFRALLDRSDNAMKEMCDSRAFTLLGWGTTFVAVAIAWVFFRAATVDGALRLMAAMAGGGQGEVSHLLLWNAGLAPATGWLWCGALGCIAFLLPNSNHWGHWMRERCTASSDSQAIAAGASLIATLLLVMLNQSRDAVSAFIYFNF